MTVTINFSLLKFSCKERKDRVEQIEDMRTSIEFYSFKVENTLACLPVEIKKPVGKAEDEGKQGIRNKSPEEVRDDGL